MTKTAETVTRRYLIARETDKAIQLAGTGTWLPKSLITVVKAGETVDLKGLTRFGKEYKVTAEFADVTLPVWLLRKNDL